MNITGSLTNKDPRRGHVVIINQSTSSNVASGFPYRRSYVIHHWCNVCLRGSNLIHYGMLQRGRKESNFNACKVPGTYMFKSNRIQLKYSLATFRNLFIIFHYLIGFSFKLVIKKKKNPLYA